MDPPSPTDEPERHPPGADARGPQPPGAARGRRGQLLYWTCVTVLAVALAVVVVLLLAARDVPSLGG